jgi:hypothetical protein
MWWMAWRAISACPNLGVHDVALVAAHQELATRQQGLANVTRCVIRVIHVHFERSFLESNGCGIPRRGEQCPLNSKLCRSLLPAPPRGHQGLTHVHFPAQHKHRLWDTPGGSSVPVTHNVSS